MEPVETHAAATRGGERAIGRGLDPSNPDSIEWTGVDTGGGLVLDLPVTEEESERLEWAASYDAGMEEWAASALAIDGEVVFLNAGEAPADVGPLRDGWLTVFVSGGPREARSRARDRVRRLCESHLVYLVLYTDGEHGVEALDGLPCPHSLNVFGALPNEVQRDLTPLAAMVDLRSLWFIHTAPGGSALEPLRGLSGLEVLGVSASVSNCLVDSLRRELPGVTVRHQGEQLPCP